MASFELKMLSITNVEMEVSASVLSYPEGASPSRFLKSAETIAEEMNCSVAAVYNLTKKARMAVKKTMKGKEK